MSTLQPRGIAKAIILSIITCGFYGIYWFVQMTDEVHLAVGRQTTASGIKALLYSLLTCGLYTFYWMYMMGKSLAEAQEQRGMHAENDAGLLYVIFTFFGLAIVSEALIQKSLNEIAYFDEQVRSSSPEDITPPEERPEPRINLLKK